MPCSDGLTMDKAGAETHYHNPTDQSQSNHSNNDFCSPFCNCCCCHTHTILHVQKINNIFPLAIDNLNGYSENFSFIPNFSIWHPPKV